MAFKGNAKVQKVMVQPINLIFRYLQNRSRVQVWLYENVNLRIEGELYCNCVCFSGVFHILTILMFSVGHIVGFDEYMNLVLDDAEEFNLKSKNRKTMGRIMLKGDNITLIQNVNPALS